MTEHASMWYARRYIASISSVDVNEVELFKEWHDILYPGDCLASRLERLFFLVLLGFNPTVLIKTYLKRCNLMTDQLAVL